MNAHSLAGRRSLALHREIADRLAREFTSLVEDFRGGTYRLSLEPHGERAFTLRRELFLPPMVLEPAAYPDFVAFAKRIDEAERARLVFAKAE